MIDLNVFLGLLALVYGGFIVFLTIKKPEKIWNIKKIQNFEKVLGKRGTEIFFYVWAILFIALGIWLLIKQY